MSDEVTDDDGATRAAPLEDSIEPSRNARSGCLIPLWSIGGLVTVFFAIVYGAGMDNPDAHAGGFDWGAAATTIVLGAIGIALATKIIARRSRRYR
jgi:hypothetical protein